MKIVFFGSDDFAACHLEALLSAKEGIICCVCPVDKAVGRGMRKASSPVKEIAVKNGIDVLQPLDLMDRGFLEKLEAFEADLFIVIAYGKILPKEVLTIPRIFSINVHASLLPKYRGAAPINWAVINGEESTGITIIKINEKMDAGEIVSSCIVPISRGDTSYQLREKMKSIGPQLLKGTVQAILAGKYKLTSQDESKVSFAPKLTKENGKIDWNNQAEAICNKVRGLLPWPSAYTFYRGKMLKILRADVSAFMAQGHKPGEVVSTDKKGVNIAAKGSVVLIKEVHLQDGKQISAFDFTLGHELNPGERLE
ncbi:MAG: methionyl-tRNA formyltransferase [Candidatus Omnitrophica bacterium]|nr:methionyl-tRNA formyltransferase [Candidatus Omnitrophota bacterium]